jgi:hypothetical protein
MIIDERIIGKDSEGSDCGLNKILSQDFSGW